MSQLVGSLQNAMSRAKTEAKDAAAAFKADDHGGHHLVDLTIKFIGASGLPKMDVVGSADPYFVANLDDKLSFVSTVKPDTLSPVWNELWKIKNVPNTATLTVEVNDKDVGNITDDHIGKFSTSVSPGAKECTIETVSFRKNRGTFWLNIESTPSTDPKAERRQYVFDGPIRFSRHFSPTVGLLTNLNDARLYSTWKIYIKGVRMFFGDTVQHWNRNYKAAQTIFQGPASIAVRSTIQAGHRMLYARSTANAFGVIDGPEDIFRLLLHGSVGNPIGIGNNSSVPSGSAGHSGGLLSGLAPLPLPNINASSPTPFAHRVKPAVYTYVIAVEDDSFRFSETGAAFFVDFASKHALHANCAQAVRYSGEFHPRPAGGWENFSDDTPDDAVQWELVIDNNSGTYSPDPLMLPDLKELLEYNFPGFTIYAWDREDPRLVHSREACRAYALDKRGVRQDELQPHAVPGQQTLSQSARTQSGPDASEQPHGAAGTTLGEAIEA
ncbi:hypothetical protein DICSQDRAFT_139837 [Dichomitus squalens LYAD-421 SS1]|uniref:C2 domain-containing protein n=1 Tax=Dichomitus squalens (strain LYAD-421) TaxID=732165 RepID=R7SSN2_DICSQ|nr:uncharacterized protein DICSQDRAFT_139837 [Dichomitus squalens LYAD-421 SS1]EJF58007.1 hypothetical protein DICSQDRAFT_139837 [Dichomitus squalens LYAD-421 SS1]